MKNIDDMTDEEIEAYLADTDSTSDNPGDGNSIRYGFFLIVAGALAAFASVQLILAELTLARDPAAALKCDINPLIGCSTFLTSWQGHLLGVSNSILGVAFFAGLIGVGVVAATGSRLTSGMWLLLVAGAGISTVWLGFFFYESFFVSGTLCPWCLVIWLSLIPFILVTAGQAHQCGAFRMGAVGSFLGRRPVTASMVAYGVVIAFIIVWFWSDWMAILG